jgi:hypothetical protein
VQDGNTRWRRERVADNVVGRRRIMIYGFMRVVKKRSGIDTTSCLPEYNIWIFFNLASEKNKGHLKLANKKVAYFTMTNEYGTCTKKYLLFLARVALLSTVQAGVCLLLYYYRIILNSD